MQRRQYITKEVNRAFKRHGLSLRGEACKAIRQFIEEQLQYEVEAAVESVSQSQTQADQASVKELVVLVLDKVKDSQLTTAFISADIVTPILAEEKKLRKRARKEAAKKHALAMDLSDDDNLLAAAHDDVTTTTATNTTSGREQKNKTTKVVKDTDVHKYIQVLDSFKSFPRLQYNTLRKTFRPTTAAAEVKKGQLHGVADEKANVFRERWHLLHQRLKRNVKFSPPPMTSGPSARDDFHEITAIESLIGQTGMKCIFGVLTELKEGQYYIEDINSLVPVDISQVVATTGLFTENCYVIAQGEFVDSVFVVHGIGMPPPEARKVTLSTFNQFYFFGLPHELRNPAFVPQHNENEAKRKIQLNSMMQGREDDMILMLSDLHLDNGSVLVKLEELFAAFEGTYIPVIVLMGDFCSTAYSVGHGVLSQRKAQFDELAEVMARYPAMCANTHFIFIPGPNDPGMGNVLPRPGLADFFTKRLRQVLKKVTFASNPTRLLYFSQEIVLFRDNLLHKMRRNCVQPPTMGESSDVSEHLVKTICDQGHLCSLPLATRPVYWNYDFSLRLYPLPDVLLLADKVDQYNWTYEDCQAFNPGSFATDFSFVVYLPATGKAEFSRIE